MFGLSRRVTALCIAAVLAVGSVVTVELVGFQPVEWLIGQIHGSTAPRCDDPTVPEDVKDAQASFIADHEYRIDERGWVSITVPQPDGNKFKDRLFVRYVVTGDQWSAPCEFFVPEHIGGPVAWPKFPVRYTHGPVTSGPRYGDRSCRTTKVPRLTTAPDGTTWVTLDCPVLVLV